MNHYLLAYILTLLGSAVVAALSFAFMLSVAFDYNTRWEWLGHVLYVVMIIAIITLSLTMIYGGCWLLWFLYRWTHPWH